MSLNRTEIFSLTVELKKKLQQAVLIDFWELESRQFILQFEQEKVLLCFQEPYLRFHLYQGKAKRKESPFAHGVSAFIHSLRLNDVEMVNEDRIVQWSFSNKKGLYYLVGEFFPKRPNLYLLNGEKEILLSLNPSEQSLYQFPENQQKTPLQVDPGVTSKGIAALYEKWEQEAHFVKQKKEIASFLNQKLRHAKKGLEKAEKELNKCQGWKESQHEATLLQANLFRMHKGLSEIIVSDWEKGGVERRISLNPLQEPKEEVEKRFKQSKKLKIGCAFAEERIAEAKKRVEYWERQFSPFNEANASQDLAPFLAFLKPSPKKRAQALPYREFHSEAGLKIWVGKSGKNNETLTFSLAKGSDWWFHVNDYPGSHVILRVNKKSEPDPESIQDAIQLAIAYSKAKEKGSAEVCITQCKFVSRLGKGTGKVQFSKHRFVHARFDPLRLKRLQ